MAEGCFNTLAGCFLWVFLFVIAYILIHIFVGIFWIAIVGALIVLIVFGFLSLIIRGILSLFKNWEMNKRIILVELTRGGWIYKIKNVY